MPVAAVTIEAPANYLASVHPVFGDRGIRHSGYLESGLSRSVMKEIRIGDLAYPLRESYVATFFPSIGEFIVDGFGASFVGRGKTMESAKADWSMTVHAAFQELLHKRHFEMTDLEVARWDVLSNCIDVTVYRNHTPLRVRQFGYVSQRRPYPTQIKWEDGKTERIRVDQVSSPDFVTYKVGQPFDAVVLRDPISFELQKIIHITRKSHPSRMRKEDERNLLKEIGSGERLQDVEWDSLA